MLRTGIDHHVLLIARPTEVIDRGAVHAGEPGEYPHRAGGVLWRERHVLADCADVHTLASRLAEATIAGAIMFVRTVKGSRIVCGHEQL